MTIIFHSIFFVYLLYLILFYFRVFEKTLSSYLELPFANDCQLSLKKYFDHIDDLECSAPDSDHGGKSFFPSRTPQAICLFLEELSSNKMIPKTYYLPKEIIKCSFQ